MLFKSPSIQLSPFKLIIIFLSFTLSLHQHLTKQSALSIMQNTKTCDVIGCRVCIDEVNQCNICIDEENTQIINGECVCKKLHKQKPNSVGFCSTCIVPGCASCISESQNYCEYCIDSKAILKNGKCYCPELSMMFNRDGFCHQCNVSGCQKCQQNQPNFCQSCIDSENTLFLNKQCLCKNITEKPDSFGFCSPCLVGGCASCVSGEQEKCAKCADINSKLINNTCECPRLMILNRNGQCHDCHIAGCHKCSKSSKNLCIQCIDKNDTQIIEGTCQCIHGLQKIDSLGQCGKCYVAGCSSCISGKQQKCYTCLDPSIAVQNGKCQCDTGMVFNKFGLCHKCNVTGCHECSAESEDLCQTCIDESDTKIIDGKCVCQYSIQKPDSLGYCGTCYVVGCASCLFQNHLSCFKCSDPKAFLKKGKCECEEGYLFNNDGFCHKCNVAGCSQCRPSSIDQCQQCIDKLDTQINGGKCQCHIKTHKPNSLGQCFQCLIEGCASCLAEDLSKCFSCIDRRAINSDGVCICEANQKLNKEGYCHKCNVIGCLHCEQGNQDICTKCVDKQRTQIIGGQCVCTSDMVILYDEKPNSQGFCSVCTISGCSSCVSTNNLTNLTQQCFLCIDEEATVEGGICKCPGEKPLDIDGFCRCRTPFCQKCSQFRNAQCFQCEQGYNPTFQGTCEQKTMERALHIVKDSQTIEIGLCSIGCSYCYNISYCLSCYDGFYLPENSSTCEKCHHNCQQCEEYDNCSSCFEGYYLSIQNQCTICQEKDCLNCTSQFCHECAIGFYLQNNKCKDCGSNCQICNSGQFCLQCEFGHIANEKGKCIQCPSTCSNCSLESYNQCDCGMGYFFNNDLCQQCSRNCLSCLSQSICVQCKEKFFLSGGLCVQEFTCECFQCKQESCTKCFSGYKIQDDSCVAVFDCQHCQICPSNYILFEGNCLSCKVNNCLQCSQVSRKVCLQCSVGFYVKDTTCYPCSQGCSQCKNEVICERCAAGYYNKQDPSENRSAICVECKAPCKSCEFSGEQCQECIEGFVLSGWRCLSEKRLDFMIELEGKVEDLISVLPQFKEQLAKISKTTQNQIIFHEIKDGSILANGSIQISSQEEGQSVLSSLNQHIEKRKNIFKFPLLSSTLSPIGFNQTIEETEKPDPPVVPQEDNFWLVFGLLFGFFVVIFIVLFILFGMMVSRREKKETEVKDKVSEQKASQNIIRKRLTRIQEEKGSKDSKGSPGKKKRKEKKRQPKPKTERNLMKKDED